MGNQCQNLFKNEKNDELNISRKDSPKEEFPEIKTIRNRIK